MNSDPSIEPESDFWDLGDDDFEIANEENPEQNAPSLDEEDALSPSEEKPDAELESISEEVSHDGATTEEPKEDIDEDESHESVDELSNDHAPISTGQTLNAVKEKTAAAASVMSAIEKTSLIAVIAILIGVAAWGLSTYYDNAPEGTLIKYDEDFPIVGTHVTIKEIETYWRKPVRKGDDLDLGVQLNARLIPCARIKLSGTGNAALALSFRDNKKELVGDPFSLEVSNGNFVKSGSHEIIVNCTAGFTDISDINPYANGDIMPWTLLIVEGESGTTPSHLDDEKKLLTIRIQARSDS